MKPENLSFSRILGYILSFADYIIPLYLSQLYFRKYIYVENFQEINFNKSRHCKQESYFLSLFSNILGS